MPTITHNLSRNITETLTRAVGPTTEIGVRGVLPDLTGIDVAGDTKIYVAMPGSDNSVTLGAGSGNEGYDSTEPVDDFADAVTLLQTVGGTHSVATRVTIHIIRDGFVGDLVFSQLDSITVDGNIQAEQGEASTLNLNVSVVEATHALTLVNVCNGLFINQIGERYQLKDGTWDNCHIKRIGLEQNASTGAVNMMTQNITTGKIAINYSLVEHPGVGLGSINPGQYQFIKVFPNAINPVMNFNNCIFVSTAAVPGNSVIEILPITTDLVPDTGANISRCIFVNNDRAIITSNANVSVSNVHTVNIDGCSFFSIGKGVDFAEQGIGIRPEVRINYDYCYLNEVIEIFGGLFGSTSADVFLSNTNEINPGALLYVNQIEGFLANPQGFRLQREGLTSPFGGGRFFIDSPLIDAFDTGSGLEDVGPWDESVTLGDFNFADILVLNFPPESLEIIPVLRNGIEIFDVNGNNHSDYDQIRNELTLSYGERIQVTNEQLWQMVQMVSRRGTKRLYFRGIGITLFIDTSNGFFVAPNTFTPTTAQPMVTDHWRGFWIIINSLHYYISTNDTTTFTLIDKLGVGFPVAGAQSFSIEYQLVKTGVESLAIVQAHFTKFEKGGRWRENFNALPTENYQYTTEQIKFFEVEDMEEDL